jgi:hypothetical protein
MVTEGASITAGFSISRCGGSSTNSLAVRVTASDADGTRVMDATDSWVPNKSVPFSSSQTTDIAAFGRDYTVTLTVTDSVTGTVLATASRAVSTPSVRIAACATVTNLGGTAGYYPGSTVNGALWLSDSIRNCGGTEWLDTDMQVTDLSTGMVRSAPTSTAVPPNGSTGYNLLDVEPVPTGTTFSVDVTVRRHLTGELLSSRSITLSTPAAK